MLVVLVDVVTRNLLGIYDHLGLSYSSQLNAAGSASVTLALEDWRSAIAIDGIGVAKTFIYLIEEDPATVAWWGLVWQAPVDVPGRTVQLHCSGIQSVLEKRTKRTDTTWTAVDEATIATDLITQAQAGTRRDLYISTAGVAATGVTRTRTVLAKDRKRFAALLVETASAVGGFDFEFTSAWTGGGTPPTHTFVVHYPAPRVSPVVTLIATGDLSLQSWQIDGTLIYSDIDVVGNQITVTRSQTLATYPGLDGAVSRSGETAVALLNGWGDAALAYSNVPRQSGTLIALLGPDDDPPAVVGQAVRLIETDVVGIDKTMVVASMSVALTGAGRTVTYSLVDPATLFRTSEFPT